MRTQRDEKREFFNKFNSLLKRNIHKINAYVLCIEGVICLVFSMYVIYRAGVEEVLVFHDIDTSLNGMLFLNDTTTWFNSSDAYGYKIIDGRVQYLTRTYPEIYINAAGRLLPIQLLGILGGLLFGIGLMSMTWAAAEAFRHSSDTGNVPSVIGRTKRRN